MELVDPVRQRPESARLATRSSENLGTIEDALIAAGLGWLARSNPTRIALGAAEDGRSVCDRYSRCVSLRSKGNSRSRKHRSSQRLSNSGCFP
jgi:hypothetical protein